MEDKYKIIVLVSDAVAAHDLQGLLIDAQYTPLLCHAADNLPEDASDIIAAIIDLDAFDEKIAQDISRDLSIPIVCLTAHAQDRSQFQSSNHAVIVLEKPFSGQDLRDNLERIIQCHHRAEQKESSQWFSSALRSIGQGIIATSPDGRVEFMNPAAEHLLDITQTKAIGQPLTDIMPLVNPLTGQKISDAEYHPAADGQPLQVHALLQRSDGSVRYIADTISPIRDQSGASLGTVMALTDITDRFHRSPHRFDSENQGKSLAEASHHYTQDAVLLIDPDHGLILDANPAMERLFGWRISDLVGRHFDTLRGDNTHTLEKIRAEGPVFVEQVMRHHAGHDVYIDLMAAIVPFGDGKAIIANLRQADERAEQSQRTREMLNAHHLQVREMNHRVKNHLHTISSLLRTRARNVATPDARRSLMSCSGQIRAIGLLHSELSKRTDDLTLDLGQYIRRLMPYVIEAAGGEDSTAQIDIEIPPMPLSPQQATPAALLIFEILNNALRHAWPNDMSCGKISIAGGINDTSGVWLEIADDGVGFDNSTPTGLGLELIEALAAQLSADISKSGPPGTKYSICWNPSDDGKDNG